MWPGLLESRTVFDNRAKESKADTTAGTTAGITATRGSAVEEGTLEFDQVRRLLAPWVSACLLLAAGCGGGGGGDNGGGGVEFRVALNRTSVQLTTEEGMGGAPAVVIASWTGTPPSPVYIAGVVEGEGVQPDIPVMLQSTHAEIVLHPRGDLLPGVYTGRVLAMVCSDAACTRTIGGTPVPIAYTLTVTPGLRVTPNPVQVAAVSGIETDVGLDLVLPLGETGFQLQVAPQVPWLEVGTANGTHQPLVFKPWRVGQYETMLAFTVGTRMRWVPVRYTVTAPPGGEHDLGLAPSSLSFSVPQGAVSPAQSLAVTLPSWDLREPVVSFWHILGSGWVDVVRTGPGYQVSINAANLSPGTYSALVTFTPAAPATAVSVPVSVTVTP